MSPVKAGGLTLRRGAARNLAVAIAVVNIPLALQVRSAAAEEASAQEWEETDVLPAVQNRKYQLHHEFSAGVGTLPTDPYTKALSVGGGYTWHINQLWAASAQGAWNFNFNTSLRDNLEGNFAIPSTRFTEIQFFGQLGALFKPMYGKFSFLNGSQVYGEVFFSLNAVVARLDGGPQTDEEPQGKGPRLAFGGAPGIGLRGFLTRRLSARFDLSWMILVDETGESNFPLFLNLQLALTSRGDL